MPPNLSDLINLEHIVEDGDICIEYHNDDIQQIAIQMAAIAAVLDPSKAF